jgi:hypothetical protein
MNLKNLTGTNFGIFRFFRFKKPESPRFLKTLLYSPGL